MTNEAIQTVENEQVVTFKNPYEFEGVSYTEIDLKGLETLTGEDLTEADKIFGSTGQFAMVNETNFSYILIVAAKASGKPQEFFNRLPARDALKVKNKVMSFLNN